MVKNKVFLVFGCLLHIHSTLALWSCTQDSDCSLQTGSVCYNGNCQCPAGQQSVLSGTLCADLAPYVSSACYEDHQCSRIFGPIECRDVNSTQAGSCFCQSGHHYFLGRCWPIHDYGEPCSRDEECLSVLRDPYSLKCNVTCSCADGYYSRQRGECRKIGRDVGDGCVINEDCQFEGGFCSTVDFRCYDVNAPLQDNSTETPPAAISSKLQNVVRNSRQSGQACDAANPCPQPFECSIYGACVCPIGYYSSGDGNMCNAELGSPSTEDQCVGLFAEVRDGICTCQVNFYFEENMRDCIKATTRLTDSCVTDSNCHTFGTAARCGPPQTWGLRSCECNPELSVWDSTRNMCRLFAGIGEACEVDFDCLAGELEIQCVQDQTGQGYCACPEGLIASDGLCLSTGLELGDACQATQECTETPNTVCEGGRCSCGSGYQEVDDYCAPIIGGVCLQNTDCVIENTICFNNTNVFTCQCDEDFVEYDDVCWPVVSGYGSTCNVTTQCVEAMGDASACTNGRCVCAETYHYRDAVCWPVTGLFESCSRTSECFLGDLSDRVVCRNSLCQCDFNYPYSEELHTCTGASAGGSSAVQVLGSVLVVTVPILLFVLS